METVSVDVVLAGLFCLGCGWVEQGGGACHMLLHLLVCLLLGLRLVLVMLMVLLLLVVLLGRLLPIPKLLVLLLATGALLPSSLHLLQDQGTRNKCGSVFKNIMVLYLTAQPGPSKTANCGPGLCWGWASPLAILQPT